MGEKVLRIAPLGGLGEIGMNCLALEYDDTLVLMDCGIQFPDASYPGVELLVPDLSYVRARRDKLKGIIVTHGHDDHIGAIPFLSREMKLNVYSTPFPKGLLINKLNEVPESKGVRYHEIRPQVPFTVGAFRFHPLPVHHSIIESVGFAIETPVGVIVHTGDFKHDGGESKDRSAAFSHFKPFGKKGVRLLFSDSTNAERPGHTISEREVSKTFEQMLSRQKGRVIIALFASNIRRVESLLKIAKKLKKRVALCGRSMHSYTELAQIQDSLKIPANTVIQLEDVHRYPDKDVIVLATGSQAEPRSALLRIARGEHRDFQIKTGDLIVLSSRFIPGNERAITTMIDHLYRQGAEVIYESIQPIHVSGHGFQEELLAMLKATRPEFFVPVHGEYRHLKKHASLAAKSGVKPKNIFVIEDGQVLELGRDGIRLAENLNVQKLALVEGISLAGDALTFSQRSNLAKTGVVCVSLVQSADRRRLLAPPQIAFHGLLFRRGEDPSLCLKEALDLVDGLHHTAGSKGDFADYLRNELRRFFKSRVSHRPLVIPLILEC